ncbi:MAG: hypothetical protein ACM4D3_10010 [Candidatus Sericytochromatia bacterium]
MFAGMASRLAVATAAAAGPESSSRCEVERDICLDSHRAEDVRGNGYIPADDFQTCMQA